MRFARDTADRFRSGVSRAVFCSVRTESTTLFHLCQRTADCLEQGGIGGRIGKRHAFSVRIREILRVKKRHPDQCFTAGKSRAAKIFKRSGESHISKRRAILEGRTADRGQAGGQDERG